MHAGIYCKSDAAMAGFLERVQDETRPMGPSGKAAIVRSRANDGEARVAVAIWREANLPLSWAERPDGAFAVVEGEFYGESNSGAVSGQGSAEAGANAATILERYSSNGAACLKALDAAAGITIWDHGRSTLLLARDRWGQVPHFYSETDDYLLWASDLRTLLRLGVADEIDAVALDFFVAVGYFPAPWTALRQIRKIPPAHVLRRRRAGSSELSPFWHATGKPELDLGIEESAERVQPLLEQAIGKRCDPARRTGALLSGGVDSALLVGVLSKVLGANVEAFTFRYGAYEGVFNENRAAAQIAKHLGVRHHVIDVNPSDISEHLESMVLAYEEPFTYGVHTYFLGDVVHREISLLMSGIGVGNWYPSPRDMLARRLRRLPLPYRTLARLITPSAASGGMNWDRRLNDILLGAATGLPGTMSARVTPDAIRRAVYADGRKAANFHRLREMLRPVVGEVSGESDRDQLAILSTRFFVAECKLLWNHRGGTAWPVQFRHPYLDNALNDFMFRLKRHFRNKPETREVAAKLMPRSLAYAPKVAQTLPIREWFRGPLIDLLRSRLSTNELAGAGLFEPAAVHRLIDDHVGGRGDHEWALWTILTTTVWQKVVLAGNALPRRGTGA